MNYERILEGILDIGEAMLCSGAENFRLDDTLYRMCKSYGFERYDVFAIPSNIQITVKTPDGEFLTQIRHIESTGINYDRLDYLNIWPGMSVRIHRTRMSFMRSFWRS